MAAHEFFFQIDLSGQPAPDMLRELATRVLGQVGCDGAAVSALVGALETAMRGAASGGPTRLRCVAHDGRLDISVSSDGRPAWRASHPIA